jgi:hypothetical protein
VVRLDYLNVTTVRHAGYCPELNSDEFVWNEVKPQTIGRQIVERQKDIKSKAIGSLRRL